MSKIAKKTVELAPSRIRRDPPPTAAEKTFLPDMRGRETWMVVVGVFVFALAIAILTFRISDLTS